jgi:hypothetical protein
MLSLLSVFFYFEDDCTVGVLKSWFLRLLLFLSEVF